MTIPVRRVAAVVVAVAAAAVVLPYVAPDSSGGWAARVALSGMSVMLVPGALATLAWHPRQSFDVFELAGIALAVSFGINQLLTIAALIAHWSAVISLALAGAFIAVSAAVAFRRRDAAVRCGWQHLLIAVGLTIVAVYLYAAGSSFDNIEDRIHVAIVERLAFVQHPSIHNIYFAPDVVYTYPFPGTHYMMALAARLGGIPALFLYLKLRPLWALAAAILLYGCTLAILESVPIAVAAMCVAVAMVANGAFAAVSMYWGQMAPFSHASDVAMGVLLPALLLMTFETIRSRTAGEYRFSIIAAFALVLMLVIVHTREIVQFVVYLCAFAGVVALTRARQPLLRRTLAILGGTAAILIAYRLWNMWAVPLVDTLVTAHRLDLRELFHGATWAELFGPPYPLMRNYMPGFEPMFYGWIPLVLLLSPLILFPLRAKPLTWLVAGSIACYALIIRFPAFAIPYTYVTYFEILYSPVRNVVFFVYLLAGVGLYLLSLVLARLPYAALIPSAAIAGVLISAGVAAYGPLATNRLDLLFAPMLVGSALLLITVIWKQPDASAGASLFHPPRRWTMAFAIVIVVVMAGTRVPDSAAVQARWQDRVPTPEALMASMSCAAGREFCAPPRALIHLAERGISSDAVLAVDLRERYQPALFMPQQMVVWPGGTESLLDPESIFPRYFEYLKTAQDDSEDQPLFNSTDTRDRREAFVRDLRVTHVLLNPRLYASMKPVFDADAALFTSRYDDGHWALYEVVRR